MINFCISAIKVIFLLGFLIFIHEGGHFIVAKLCKVRVNEFAIGFGPTIFKRKYKETLYEIRLIPLGGFVRMEGEENASENEGAFNKASIIKRIAIVAAGAIINIIFGFIVYFVIVSIIYKNIQAGVDATGKFSMALINSLKMMFSGNIGINDLTGPVGISQIASKTVGIMQYMYLMSVISISLGITNLLPIPALDGGKIILLIIEAIRRKPLKENTEIKIQMLGFLFIISLAIIVTFNDILKLF